MFYARSQDSSPIRNPRPGVQAEVENLLHGVGDRDFQVDAIFDYVFRAATRQIYRLNLRNGADGEDIRQNVSLKTWKVLDRREYDPSRARFGTLLHRIIRNEISNYFCRGGRSGRMVFGLDADPMDRYTLSGEDVAAIRELVGRAVELAFRINRKPVFKLVLAIREGLSDREIAARCGQSRNTVKKDLRRLIRQWIDLIRAEFSLTCLQAKAIVAYILNPHRNLSLATGDGDERYN